MVNDNLIEAYHAGRITKEAFLKQARENMWLVIAKVPDLQGKAIVLQDFIVDGRLFIPVFSSSAIFSQLTQGYKSREGFGPWQIKGELLFRLLGNVAWVRFNPDHHDEIAFSGEEL